MKPLFGTAMTSRIGAAIGKGMERVMLSSVGGAAGIRKAYHINPDGTVTRLSTRAGFPEFITPKPPSNPVPFVIGVGEANGNYRSPCVHTITLSRAFGNARDYPFSLVDVTTVAGLDYATPLTSADFSDGVLIAGGTITVPPGVTLFTATVTVLLNTSAPDPATYEMHVGSSIGIGSIFQI